MSRVTIVVMSAILGSAALTATAAELDGSKTMLCAARVASVCEETGNCASTLPEAINLPIFWKVDPVAKSVESRRGVSDEPRTSKVSQVVKSGGKLILQGEDDGLGWTVTIAPDTGKMILSGGRELGFTIFGNCVAQ